MRHKRISQVYLITADFLLLILIRNIEIKLIKANKDKNFVKKNKRQSDRIQKFCEKSG